MKKLFMALLILTVLYTILENVLKILSPGHEVVYEVNNNIKVEEKYTKQKEFANYRFNIKIEETEFEFFSFENLKRKEKVITNIESFSYEQYFCIVPEFMEEKVYTILCQKNDIVYNFEDIIDKNNDKYTEVIDKYSNYDSSKYLDDAPASKVISTILYKENLNRNHTVSLSTYRGLVNFTDTRQLGFQEVPLFAFDRYKKTLEYFFENQFIVADYDAPTTFDKFYIINTNSGKTDTINYDKGISHNSYFQGTYDGDLYLYDKDNSIQYKINIEDKIVTAIGDSATSIKHYDGEKLIDKNTRDYSGDEIIFETKGDNNKLIDTESFSVLYELDKTKYNFYLESNESEKRQYLFSSNTLRGIQVVDEDIYFLEGNEFRTFNFNSGVRKIFNYSEISINDTIKIYVSKR